MGFEAEALPLEDMGTLQGTYMVTGLLTLPVIAVWLGLTP